MTEKKEKRRKKKKWMNEWTKKEKVDIGSEHIFLDDDEFMNIDIGSLSFTLID